MGELLLLSLCPGLGIWLFGSWCYLVSEHELKLSHRSGRTLARLRSISEISARLLAGLRSTPVTQSFTGAS